MGSAKSSLELPLENLPTTTLIASIPGTAVNTIIGCPDVKQENRHPVLKIFFDTSQPDRPGIIVVTSNRIEIFCRFSGRRHHRKQYEYSNNSMVTVDYNQRSRLGSILAVGFENGLIEILESTTLKSIDHFSSLINQIQTHVDHRVPYLPKLKEIKILTQVAILIGFSDGMFRVFHLFTKQLFVEMDWKNLNQSIDQNYLASSQTSSAKIMMAKSRRDPLEVRTPRSVTSIGFYKLKNWILLGFEGHRILTNETRSRQTELLDISPPVCLFPLGKSELIGTFGPTLGAVIYVSTIDIPRNKQSLEMEVYLLAVTSTHLHLWPLSEAFDKFETKTCLSICFLEALIGNLQLGPCVSAAIDGSASVVFLLFQFGYLTILTLFHCDDKEDLTMQTENRNDAMNGIIDYSIYRLLKIQAVPNSLDFEFEDDENPQVISTALAYEDKSQTILVGDWHSRIQIASDLFGCHQALQVMQNIEFEEAINETNQKNISRKQFVPTLYVGGRDRGQAEANNTLFQNVFSNLKQNKYNSVPP